MRFPLLRLLSFLIGRSIVIPFPLGTNALRAYARDIPSTSQDCVTLKARTLTLKIALSTMVVLRTHHLGLMSNQLQRCRHTTAIWNIGPSTRSRRTSVLDCDRFYPGRQLTGTILACRSLDVCTPAHTAEVQHLSWTQYAGSSHGAQRGS